KSLAVGNGILTVVYTPLVVSPVLIHPRETRALVVARFRFCVFAAATHQACGHSPDCGCRSGSRHRPPGGALRVLPTAPWFRRNFPDPAPWRGMHGGYCFRR